MEKNKKQKKYQSVEDKRIKKYIMAVIIYTVVMLMIIVFCLFSPGKKVSLPFIGEAEEVITTVNL